MPRLSIERFEPSDAAEVRELDHAAMATTPEYNPDAPDPDLDAIADTYLDGDGEFLVGRLDALVAMGAYRPPSDFLDGVLDPPDATRELARLRVHPEYRREGYARAITEELITRARERGVESFVLETGAENGAARAFYEAQGFELVAERSVTFEGQEMALAIYRHSLVGN